MTAYDDDDAEAEGVAFLVLDSADAGRPWSDHAVLARTNEQLVAVSRALSRAGIPHRLSAGPAEVVDGPDQTSDADRGSDPDDPSRDGASAGGEEPFPAEADRPVDAGPRPRPTRRNAVELATFHRAKGLEWDSVFVVGLEDGFVPIAYAASTESRAEERRLLYVALTRAVRQLHCSWARRRRIGTGRPRDRDPSPWLAAVARVSRPGTGRPSPAQAGLRIAELRAALRR